MTMGKPSIEISRHSRVDPFHYVDCEVCGIRYHGDEVSDLVEIDVAFPGDGSRDEVFSVCRRVCKEIKLKELG